MCVPTGPILSFLMDDAYLKGKHPVQHLCKTVGQQDKHMILCYIMNLILEQGAHIKSCRRIHRQIEILHSAKTVLIAKPHVRNKCVHLCAYRYQVLNVI